jgi:hypothetical protein
MSYAKTLSVITLRCFASLALAEEASVCRISAIKQYSSACRSVLTRNTSKSKSLTRHLCAFWAAKHKSSMAAMNGACSLQNTRLFPTFEQLPVGENFDSSYYVETAQGKY